jgi:hypothetical protein
VEDHLEEQIAELLLESRGVPRFDRLEHFVRFLDEKRLERGAGLLAIPRASPRPTQTAHDLEEPFEENTGGLGHDRFLRVE